ncbi:MAG TPA: N-6 DNA methylase, partial [Gemmatimonadaceae bacterium]|nr:N-6 DNA methylase [Gemmatimonadaceae bacterium]
MQTLRSAAALLAAADSVDRLAPVATALGCDCPPAPLDHDTQRALGITEYARDARIVAGPGAIRILLLEFAVAIPIRERLPRLASRLSARAPHVLWLVVGAQPDTGDVAIAGWTGERRPPRVAALVANRRHVVDSDAETLRALTAVAAGSARDLLVHARWIEVLGRSALTRRFYAALEGAVHGLADSCAVGDSAVRHELALLDTSRLLFLAFLEAKGWLAGDRAFLVNQFEECLLRGGRFRQRVLRPLFFGTLNTPIRERADRAKRFGAIPFLNGGLFARTALERRHGSVQFSDDAYGRLLFDVFAQYRFTAREETATWSEVAVDPEMLGHAFESLMAARDRKHTGAFFTPFTLVERVTTGALEAALAGRAPAERRASLEAVTILDPACGSGAFLVHALDRVAAMLGDAGDRRDVSTLRRDVLTRSIFGVDLNPVAVWLCQLRLWLSIVIESDVEDPAAVLPLPNLDRNIRVGDALAGRDFGALGAEPKSAAIRRLRERYARASGARKETLARQLDRTERQRAVRQIDLELARAADRRRDLLAARRGRDLFGDRYRPSLDERAATAELRTRSRDLRATRRRVECGGALPFSFDVHFADVAARGGFDVVIGNPPWVRMHHVPLAERE